MKVKASLADISTEYVNPEPDTYEFEFAEVKTTESNDGGVYRQTVHLKPVIISPGDHKGKPLAFQISVHKKDGELNTAGLADLKRIMEPLAPEEAEQDEPDPDVLLKCRFSAEVYHEQFTYTKGPNVGKSGTAARINLSTITAI